MAPLRISKIKVLSSEFIYYALFEEGDLSHPLCLLTEREAENLLREFRAQKQEEE